MLCCQAIRLLAGLRALLIVPFVADISTDVHRNIQVIQRIVFNQLTQVIFVNNLAIDFLYCVCLFSTDTSTKILRSQYFLRKFSFFQDLSIFAENSFAQNFCSKHNFTRNFDCIQG